MELSSLEGRLLAGRFQLGDLLGQGGYGAVFKGEQVSMGRPCAVKILAPHLVSSDETVKRFELEARATSRLTHSNTIVVYDFGRDPDSGLLFLAMEYLDGDDLDQYVKRRGPLSVGQALHVLEQMAGSLQDAHDAGLVHRDVKPKNAMVTERGADPLFVKLIDFGISKAFDPISNQRASFLELTETGMVVGTPQYMSPEQLRNDSVDGRSDQYSLAITAYRILTGRTPFMGASLVDVAVKHISETPLPLRAYRPELTVTADFEGVLLQALSKDPDARFDSMLAFAYALRASVDGLDLAEEADAAEPWADAETGSMPFSANVADETESLAGQAIAEHVEPEVAFAPTEGMEAQLPDETPVHLGGTLARKSGNRAKSVDTDDVPGSTLVVLRDASESNEGVGSREHPDSETRDDEWTLGAGRLEQSDEPAGEGRRPTKILWFAALVGVCGVIGALAVGLTIGGTDPEPVPTVMQPVHELEFRSESDRSMKEPHESGTTTAVQVPAVAPTNPPMDAEVEGMAPMNDEPAKPADSAVAESARDQRQPNADPIATQTKETAPIEEPSEDPGKVKVVLIPWGDLYVDGERRGDATRQRLVLEPGSYLLELRQGGTTRDKSRVRVRSGKTLSVTLRAR